MADSYKTIYRGGEAEIVEKKSRFIATVRCTETEEEALSFIKEMKKKYYDARHNCSAYIIGTRRETMRSSDDGEPQGTAGHPMLDVLLGEDLCNVTVVVTRYFGGVLLGTGGLVRAYSKAVQEGLAASVIMEKLRGTLTEIRTDYNGVGKLKYLIGQMSIPEVSTEYGEAVMTRVVLSGEEKGKFLKDLTEATNGRAEITELSEVWFSAADGEVLVEEI